MTLVVARKFGKTAWVVADTLFSGGTLGLREREYGLKLFRLDAATIIAYAGVPEDAHCMLSGALSRSTRKSAKTLAEIVAEETQGKSLDFIILQAGQIVSIKNNRVEEGNGSAWIGDHQAFSAFQEYNSKLSAVLSPQIVPLFTKDGGPQAAANLQLYNVETLCGAGNDDAEKGMRLHRAMELVVGDLSISSVGGPVTVAISGAGNAQYLSFSSATSPVFRPSNEKWTSVDFGDAQNGGFCFTTITSTRTDICGWGVFYHQNGRGMYFSAELAKNTFDRYFGYSANADKFCDSIANKLSYRPTHCGSFGNASNSSDSKQ